MQIFELYISKLNPNRNDLWQRPKKQIADPFIEWYDNQVVGRDPLNATMKKISINAKLSQIYNNHSIRATTVGILSDEFEARHVMAHTGHKSESTIKTYARKCPAIKRRAMSKSLGNHLFQQENENSTEEEVTAPPNKKSKAQSTAFPTPNPEVVNAIQVPDAQQLNPDIQLPENMEAFEIEEDELQGDQLIEILEKIEKENQHLFPNQNNQLVPQNENPTPKPAVLHPSVNVANVANIANVQQHFNKEKLPLMYFPGSNVTINYNFKN